MNRFSRRPRSGRVAGLGLILLALAQTAVADTGTARRVISVGATITEIAFALDAGDRLIAVDTTSLFPMAAQKLPKVGYQRTLSAEGILSLQPDLVLVTDEAGPPTALDQVRGAGVRVVVLPQARQAIGAGTLIRGVAEALGQGAAGDRLARKVDADLTRASVPRSSEEARPRVIFLHAMGSGPMLAGGTATVADELIRLAGGRNAAGDFAGFKPLSAEALAAADPDVVLVSPRGLASIGGPEGLFAVPGMAATRAATSRRVVTLDDAHLLGFGPRSGDAIAALARGLAPAAPVEQAHP